MELNAPIDSESVVATIKLVAANGINSNRKADIHSTHKIGWQSTYNQLKITDSLAADQWPVRIVYCG